jgi:F0F1-type ATP synthase assembly protein I
LAQGNAGARREGTLSDRLKDEPTKKAPDYDALLHRHKGISGSEFAGVGLQFGITIVLFAFAGVWLDKKLGTSPWLVIVMVFGGATLGFWSMYRRVTGASSGGGAKK